MITSSAIPLIWPTRPSSLSLPSGLSAYLSKSNSTSAARVTFSVTGFGAGVGGGGVAPGFGAVVGGSGCTRLGGGSRRRRGDPRLRCGGRSYRLHRRGGARRCRQQILVALAHPGRGCPI